MDCGCFSEDGLLRQIINSVIYPSSRGERWMNGHVVRRFFYEERTWLGLILLIFAAGVLKDIDTPGLYMDAINPEYLVAHTLRPELHNPEWVNPNLGIPILGNLYHGVQNYYLGLPFFGLVGTTLAAVRVFHGLFGAVILFLVFRILVRSAVPICAAGLATIALAVDPAFLISFRTQYVIILGGTAWALLSIYCITSNHIDAGRQQGVLPRSLFLSGVFFGLSIYGYFVLGFLGPAMLWMVLTQTGTMRTRNKLGWWSGGVLTGLLTYVAGYLAWWVAMGNFRNFVHSIMGGVHSLQPLQPQSLISRITQICSFAQIAWSNHGAELLMMGERVSSSILVNTKFLLLSLLVILGILGMAIRRRDRLGSVLLAPAMLLSYCICATAFGSRLWAHHFGAVLPFVYLAAGTAWLGISILLNSASAERNRRAAGAFGILIITIIMLSSIQQHKFFSRLAETGGTGKFTDALSLLADRAIRSPNTAVYVFPEWGFYMSFTFLTGNRIPYELSCDTTRVKEAIASGKMVVVSAWNPDGLSTYERELEQIGAHHFVRETMVRRDGAPAFYLLHASVH
jgi:hypothetical protein